MPHGLPDFGATSGGNTTYQLNDMAELAARLGSIDTYDRLGDVYRIEDFESSPAGFWTGGYGAGNAGYRSLDCVNHGSFSCCIVTGSDGAHSAHVVIYCALPSISRLGFELAQAGGSTGGKLEQLLAVYTGTRYLLPAITYDHVTDALYYENAAHVFIEFASGIVLPVGVSRFNVWKMVVDLEAEEYVRFMLNELSWSLAGLACPAGAASGLGQLGAQLSFTGQDGFNQSAYVDDVILTQNEP